MRLKNYLLEVKDWQKKNKRFELEVKYSSDADKIPILFRDAGLKIGDDWDWLTSNIIGIGKKAFDEVEDWLMFGKKNKDGSWPIMSVGTIPPNKRK